MAALTAAAEPRLNKVSLLLGGGGLVDAFWDLPQAAPLRKVLAEKGITKETVKQAAAPADPLTYAETLKKRDLLMIAASKDDIVPPAAAKAVGSDRQAEDRLAGFDPRRVGVLPIRCDGTYRQTLQVRWVWRRRGVTPSAACSTRG